MGSGCSLPKTTELQRRQHEIEQNQSYPDQMELRVPSSVSPDSDSPENSMEEHSSHGPYSCFPSSEDSDGVKESNRPPCNARFKSEIILLLHGNNGTPRQLFNLRDMILNKFPHAAVMIPSCNSRDTLGGVALGGRRIADQFRAYLKQNNFVGTPRLSVVGHSLGGLYARYFIRELYRDKELWDSVCPTSFMSCNTPHLGARKDAHNLRAMVVSKGADIYSKIVKQTGEDLFLRNNLLMKMSEPGSDFMKALESFPYRTLVGVVAGDFVVSLCSSCLRKDIPHPVAKNLNDFCNETLYPDPMRVTYSGFSDEYDDVFQQFETQFSSIRTRVPSYEQVDKEWDFDSLKESRFKSQMLANLDKIGFRRVEMEYHVYNKRKVLNGSLHGMTLQIDGTWGKLSFLRLTEKENSGPQSLDLITEILLKDHQRQKKELQTQKLA